ECSGSRAAVLLRLTLSHRLGRLPHARFLQGATMSSSMPPPHGGSPQQPGAGAQPPVQGSPYPPAPQGGWQPQNPLSPHSAPGYGPQAHGSPNPGHGPAPMAPQYAAGPYAGGPGPYASAQQPPKDFVVAWLLAMFLGFLGVDRFYRGFIGL